MPKKLVLAVIDSLKPGHARPGGGRGRGARARRADRVRHLHPRLRLDLPVRDPGGLGGDRHRLRPGRAPHPVDELVPPRRGALRGVRLVAARDARVRDRPLALRHRLQHEPGAPQPGAQDGLRAPRRRRLPHRLHHLPDLPRPYPATTRRARASTGGSPRPRSSATRSTGRASSSTPTCSTRATPAAPRRSGCRASATGTRAASAPTSSSTTCSTSCSSRFPDNDTYSHKVGPDGQVRSIAEADRALERIMHVAGGPEAFLEEHAVIVMSDHSQTTVETGINLAEVLADARVLMPSDRSPTEAELAACPSARSAMVYALDEGAGTSSGPRPTRSSRPTAWARDHARERLGPGPLGEGGAPVRARGGPGRPARPALGAQWR